MALDDLAATLNAALDNARNGQFSPAPYYDEESDTLTYYARSVRSHAKRVNRYLTLFLSIEDGTLVGFMVKELEIIFNAAQEMGAVPLAPAVEVADGDGAMVSLSVLVRCSLVPDAEMPLSGRDLEELGRISSGVQFTKGRRACHA